ncbi:MFS transporter [Effusibacillus lacus]|uniref:MFS transporter n=1 Tax=Effusibacillus lacus TaxID=1348429 RepID=A0A292YK02_9BACL|nr:MFS transporter [Effusibacillus lacus]TCS74354.1 PPP family 3-phenylpropionic acid transporter [Effusibacillus lacus]GAX88810.1 MFS transporter [Effusibacillus lacus]
MRTITYRLGAFYFLLFFGFGAHLPLLSLYLKDFGLTGMQIGTLLAAGPIVSILVQPFWGMVSDRFQAQKKILVLTLTLAAVSGLLFTVADTFRAFLILYVFLVLFQSAIVPIIDAVTLSHVQKVKGDYGSVRLYGALGFAIAVWVAGHLSEAVGLQSIFYLYGGAFLICVGIAITLPHQGLPLSTSIWSGLGKLLRIPQYIVFLVAAFLIFGPINANNSYFSLFYTAIGGAVAGVGTAFLLFAGSEAPIMRVAGRFAKRYGMLSLIVLSGTVSAIRWYYYASQPSPRMVIALFLLQGISVGLFLPIAASYIRENTPIEVQVTAQAIYAAFANGLGTMVASYAAGWLLDHFGIFSTYRYFAFSSLIGAILLVLLAVRQKNVSIKRNFHKI